MAISYRRVMASNQVAMRTDLRAMFKRLSDQLGALVQREAGADGVISRREEERIRQQARAMVNSYFVNPYPFASSDGVTALAPYPQILNRYYVRVVGQVVDTHTRDLTQHLSPELLRWLQSARIPDGVKLKETRRSGMILDIDPRLVQEMSPREALVNYDPMHTWVDPRGYRLSDRIWRITDETRRQIDDLLAESIRLGRSSRDTAKLLERFLNPDAASLRTKKPYGSDGSLAAVRLARSEISRAHNHAAQLAAQLNPYVEGLDVVRSKRGDAKCPICPQHATIDLAGKRVRPPYPKDTAQIPPYHPNDMCNVQSVVTDNPDAVINELQAQYEAGQPAPVTPAAKNTLLQFLFGYALYSLWSMEEPKQ